MATEVFWGVMGSIEKLAERNKNSEENMKITSKTKNYSLGHNGPLFDLVDLDPFFSQNPY